METGVYQIKLTDGRIFNIFCKGKSQKNRLGEILLTLDNIEDVRVISNGIHTIKEFEQIVLTLNK